MIDQNTGEVISLSEAQTLTENFQRDFPNDPKAYFLGYNKIKDILNQQNCIGIRCYQAYDANENVINIVIVGVDSDQRDMTNGLILDKAKICPNQCDPSSALYF